MRPPLARAGWATWLILACIGGMLVGGSADIAIFFAYPVLVANLSYNGAAAARIFGNRLVHHLGVISYSIYLVHPLIATASRRAGSNLAAHLGDAGLLLGLLLYVIVVYALSVASFRLIEGHGRKYVMGLCSRLA